MICIEDIFQHIVTATNTRLSDRQIPVCFQFGTLREIVDNLNTLTRARAQKYPLIALIEPFRQQKGTPGTDTRISVRLLIATYTEKTLKADERLRVNFKPLLFPIYDAFLAEIKRSEHFNTEEVKHTVINHFEIGRESLSGYDGSVFNDHIDAIEIQDMELNVKPQQCKIKNF